MDYTSPTFHRFDVTGNPNFTSYPVSVPGVKAGDIVVQELDAINNKPMFNKDWGFTIRPVIEVDDYAHPLSGVLDDTMTVSIIVIRDHPVAP